MSGSAPNVGNRQDISFHVKFALLTKAVNARSAYHARNVALLRTEAPLASFDAIFHYVNIARTLSPNQQSSP